MPREVDEDPALVFGWGQQMGLLELGSGTARVKMERAFGRIASVGRASSPGNAQLVKFAQANVQETNVRKFQET
jgi:hypothetical protein